jgi:hypothetical protein
VPELVAQKVREKMDVAHKFANRGEFAVNASSEGKSRSRKKKA